MPPSFLVVPSGGRALPSAPVSAAASAHAGKAAPQPSACSDCWHMISSAKATRDATTVAACESESASNSDLRTVLTDRSSSASTKLCSSFEIQRYHWHAAAHAQRERLTTASWSDLPSPRRPFRQPSTPRSRPPGTTLETTPVLRDRRRPSSPSLLRRPPPRRRRCVLSYSE